MTQPTLNEMQLAELADSLELAITLEQQAKELCELTEMFAEKWETKLKKFQPAPETAGGV